jgi:hypothetical protein
MHAAAHAARHVQIGHSAGAEVTLPAQLVRSSRLHLLGFAFMHAPCPVRRAAYLALTEHAARSELHVGTLAIPLARSTKRGSSRNAVPPPTGHDAREHHRHRGCGFPNRVSHQRRGRRAR